MTPERWQQVKQLFDAALERAASERAAFLQHTCSADAILLHEVESLLALHDSADRLLDHPVGAVAAQLLAEQPSATLIGETISTYKIEREIGRGGMGEVYLAWDTRLDRPVAIKLLPTYFSQDPDRVRRFQQEARAASSLNHPNIVTIHEVGQAEGQRFIVSEFVAGLTLREVIKADSLKLDQALDIVIQTANALSAAHLAGIAHRDIKPENLMVRSDGYVKVLDFGLAKLTERGQGLGEAQQGGANLAEATTQTGVVMGTVKYMSPEQARGQKVDQRTDIFSLGVVLYETITGRLPFDGETPSHTVVAILEQEPAPIAEYMPDAPAELQQVIDRMLRKNRDERYQTSEALRRDLEELKSAVNSGSYHQARHVTGVARTTSSAQYLASQIKRHKFRFATIFSLLLLAGLGVGLYKLLAPAVKNSPLLSASLTFTKLAGPNDAYGAISPDGKYVVYTTSSVEAGNPQSLMVRQLATGSTARLAQFPAPMRQWGFRISPDSNFVYTWLYNPLQSDNYIERIPLSPGPSQRVAERVRSVPAISPDAQRIAFVRGGANDDETELILADAGGGNEQVLAHHAASAPVFGRPAWSPDGTLIAIFTRALKQPYRDGHNHELIGVRVDNGAEVRLNAQRWSLIRGINWLPDGTGLLISAIDHPGAPEQIWLISYPDGSAHRLTPELASFEDVSITTDSRRMLTSQTGVQANIWMSSLSDPTRATKLTANAAFYDTLSVAPDGSIAYDVTTTLNSSVDIWLMGADGSNRRQLTFGPGVNGNPIASPDGRYIVFPSNRTGPVNLWRINLDGSELKQLTTGAYDIIPVFAPDGRWVIYESLVDNRTVFYKVSIDGGTPEQVGEANVNYSPLAISPDGKRLAYQTVDETSKKERVVIRSLDTGAILQEMDLIGQRELLFSPDGASLLYAEDHNIWRQPLNGGPRRPVTDFTTEVAIWFALSRDGKNLIVTRGSWTSDLILISAK